MRVAELSRRAGVPIATIKYYLREGLLQPGVLTSPNQARYDERHLRRLRLIRALLDIGRLPLATIRELLADIDRPDPKPHHLLGRALQSVGTGREPAGDEALAAAERDIDELIARRGWRVDAHASARRAVAEVVAALRQLGLEDFLAHLDEYADAVERVAAADLEIVRHRGDPEAMVYGAVVGTILGDRLLAGLRRLAQEDASARLFHHHRKAADS